jgi:hypothetical protein
MMGNGSDTTSVSVASGTGNLDYNAFDDNMR